MSLGGLAAPKVPALPYEQDAHRHPQSDSAEHDQQRDAGVALIR
jgi:hypothetical protein